MRAAVLLIAGIAALAQNPDRLLEEANAEYRSLHPAEAVRLYQQYLDRGPDRPDVRVFLGGALLNLEQLAPAFEQAQRAIAINARYAKAYILAGRVSAARREWNAAQSFFETAQHLDDRDIETWYFSGRAYYDANRFEAAIAAFEEALRRGAEQGRVYENLALAQDALGRFDLAGKSFRKAVDLAHGAWRPYLAYGAFLFRQDRPFESLPLLRRAFALAPDAPGVRFELARVLYQSDRFEEAARVLEPARSSNECRVRNLLARIYYAWGKDTQAGAEIEAVKTCKPAPDSP